MLLEHLELYYAVRTSRTVLCC